MSLSKKNNLILIGLPASGKTLFAKNISMHFNVKHIDTDEMIEKEKRMPISKIFEKFGEEKFREIETDVLKKIARKVLKNNERDFKNTNTRNDLTSKNDFVNSKNNLDNSINVTTKKIIKKTTANNKSFVISTGGGIILKKENVRILKKLGVIIFIDRPINKIIEDQNFQNNRPLLKGENDLLRLDKERRKLYESCSNIIFSNKNSFAKETCSLNSQIALLGIFNSMCLIGDPVSHSLSPIIHNEIFKRFGLSKKYLNSLVTKNDLKNSIDKATCGNLKGFNVTIPHKNTIIPYLDDIKGDAKLSKSVNTVKRIGKKLVGFNTDMEGLVLALKRIGYSYKNKNVTVLGAGGVSTGIVTKAFLEGAKSVTVICRKDTSKIKKLFPSKTVFVKHLDITKGLHKNKNAVEVFKNTDILINATPIGMSTELSREIIFEINNGMSNEKSSEINCEMSCGINSVINCEMSCKKIYGLKKELDIRLSETKNSTWCNQCKEQSAKKNKNIKIDCTVKSKMSATDTMTKISKKTASKIKSEFSNLSFLHNFKSITLIVDLIYNPSETKLLREAKKKKIKTLNGLPMLIYQAILSDEIIFKVKPNREKIFNMIYKKLEKKIIGN